MIFRWLGRFILYGFFTTVLASALLAIYLYIQIEPQLPSIEVLREVQLQEPLRIYTRDRKLLAEFGEKRRTPVAIGEVPAGLVQAFLAGAMLDERIIQADVEQGDCFSAGQQHFIDAAACPSGNRIFFHRNQM